jgi:hypothetical protein
MPRLLRTRIALPFAPAFRSKWARPYVFAKDRDFQEFLRTPEAARAAQSLRIRRAPQNGAVVEPVVQPAKPARVVEAASESRSRS